MPKRLIQLGLAGIHPEESPLTHQLNHLFRLLVLVFLMVLPILWYLDQQKIQLIDNWIEFGSWLIWGVLLAEFLLMLGLVRNRKRYLQQNWLNLPILLLTFPMILGEVPYAILLRLLQFILIARYFSELLGIMRRFLHYNQLGAIGIGFIASILISGILIHSIDPNISRLEDGLWWALVTMTTLGYGDVVPVSTEGRIFGAVVVLLGAVFFSMFTANMAAFLVGEDAKKDEEILRIVRDTQNSLYELTQKDDKRLAQTLEQLKSRMDHLERIVQSMQNMPNNTNPASDTTPEPPKKEGP